MANKRTKWVVYLPLDIIFDILSRLPVRSLMRFKCVSKDWLSLIGDPSFVDAHLQIAKADNGFIVETPIPMDRFCRVLKNIVPDRSFVEFQYDRLNSQSGFVNATPISRHFFWDPFFLDVKTTSRNNRDYFHGMTSLIGDLTCISATCDGLVLLESLSKYGIFYVCNPATRRWLCLGQHIDPPECFHTWGLAFDPSIRKYKVVRMTSRKHRDVCQIIKVDKNFNSWTEVLVPKPHRPRSFPPLYANSSFHWMIHHRDLPDLEGSLGFNPQSKGYILSMDVAGESFRLILHPECKSGCYSLLVMKGLLCFADHVSHSQLDFWVLNNAEKLIWTKEHSINMNSIGGSVRTKSFLDDIFPLVILENPLRIIFKWIKKQRRLFSYDIEKQSFSTVNLQCFFITSGNNDILGDGEQWSPKIHINSLACWDSS